MRIFKKIILALTGFFVLLQLIRPAKNRSNAPVPGDISKVTAVPERVLTILKKACYDCHSNNTAYPWYANIQPVGLYLDWHIRDGKKELNFNEFGTYSAKRQHNKLESIAEQVKDGEMPLTSYTLLHIEARLTPSEKTALTKWVEDVLNATGKN